jgi:hypothetical protein
MAWLIQGYTERESEMSQLDAQQLSLALLTEERLKVIQRLTNESLT